MYQPANYISQADYITWMDVHDDVVLRVVGLNNLSLLNTLKLGSQFTVSNEAKTKMEGLNIWISQFIIQAKKSDVRISSINHSQSFIPS